MINAYEIRFFQVGSASKGGDAILIRLLDEDQKPTIIVVDGGYKETGEKIIAYLKNLNISYQHPSRHRSYFRPNKVI